MASRNISDLHPKLQPLCTEFMNRAQEAGVQLIITCTYRSNAEQTELYAQGRTAPGPKVTNTPAGKSKHNNTLSDGTPAALAFDVVPLRNGKCVWDDSATEWQTLGKIGQGLGLDWGGSWRNFKDYPHFQLDNV